jgi:hypothetical protein
LLECEASRKESKWPPVQTFADNGTVDDRESNSWRERPMCETDACVLIVSFEFNLLFKKCEPSFSSHRLKSSEVESLR